MDATLSVPPRSTPLTPDRALGVPGGGVGPNPGGQRQPDPKPRDGRRLLRRLATVVAGVGVFAVASSVIEPRPSSARDLNADGPQPPSWGQAAVDNYDPATRERVQKKLVEAKHPQGWPVLGLLEGVEYYVVIHGSPEGPRYTVCSLQGRVLQADLPKDDVYRAFPTLDVEGMRLEPAAVPDGPALMLADPAGRE